MKNIKKLILFQTLCSLFLIYNITHTADTNQTESIENILIIRNRYSWPNVSPGIAGYFGYGLFSEYNDIAKHESKNFKELEKNLPLKTEMRDYASIQLLQIEHLLANYCNRLTIIRKHFTKLKPFSDDFLDDSEAVLKINQQTILLNKLLKDTILDNSKIAISMPALEQYVSLLNLFDISTVDVQTFYQRSTDYENIFDNISKETSESLTRTIATINKNIKAIEENSHS